MTRARAARSRATAGSTSSPGRTPGCSPSTSTHTRTSLMASNFPLSGDNFQPVNPRDRITSENQNNLHDAMNKVQEFLINGGSVDQTTLEAVRLCLNTPILNERLETYPIGLLRSMELRKPTGS